MLPVLEENILAFSTGDNANIPDNPQGSQHDHESPVPNKDEDKDKESLNYWVAGFIEGEGSFNIAFKLNKELRIGMQAAPEFSVSQHVSGKSSCPVGKELVKKALNNVGNSIKPKSGTEHLLVYTVTNLKQLNDVVIPFLQKYNTYSARKAEMATLAFVCQQMKDKQHLNVEGMTRIIERVFITPLKKGNRQLSKEDLLSVLGNQTKAAELSALRRLSKDSDQD